jgi:hypothetical protein
MTARIIPIFIVFCILAGSGCAGKNETDKAIASSQFASELRVLKDITDALSTYRNVVKSNTEVNQVTAANVKLLGILKKLSPQIEVIVKNHPEWESEPPADVARYVTAYLTANEEFTKDTILLTSDFVQNHPDDKELVDSYDALVAFLSP